MFSKSRIRIFLCDNLTQLQKNVIVVKLCATRFDKYATPFAKKKKKRKKWKNSCGWLPKFRGLENIFSTLLTWQTLMQFKTFDRTLVTISLPLYAAHLAPLRISNQPLVYTMYTNSIHPLCYRQTHVANITLTFREKLKNRSSFLVCRETCWINNVPRSVNNLRLL